MLTHLPFKRLAASKLLPIAIALTALHCGNTGPGDQKPAGTGGSAGSDDVLGGDTTATGGSGGREASPSTSASGGSGGSDEPSSTSASGGGGNGGSGGNPSTGGSTTDTGGSSPTGSVGGSAGAGAFEGADPRCDVDEPGTVCLGHFVTSCTDDDDDGVLEFTQENCAPGVCAGEDPHCTGGKAGESCADAIVVKATGFVLRGTDFASDFAGDIDLSNQPSCDFGDAGSSDAVFAVSLEAGQVLSVTQKGTLPTVLAVQTECGAENVCSESDSGGAGLPLEHTASEQETVYVILDAYQAGNAAHDYALHIDIDATCGNGIYEGPEGCDDGNTAANDGCSPACNIEFPYQCTESSPSLCQEPESLGSIGAEAELKREVTTSFDEDDRLFLSFTLSERVVLDVSAVSNTNNTGDINFRIFRDWGDRVITGTLDGDEEYSGVLFEPGTYLIELWAVTDLPEGFTLSLTSHSSVCGDSVVVEYIEACDNGGGEGCVDCEVVFGWDCGYESPSECTEIPSLGAFAAGDPIEPVEGAVDYGAYLYWMIEFLDDVWLSGTAVNQGDDEFALYSIAAWSEDQLEQSTNLYPPGDFGPWMLPAGIYKLELLTYNGVPDGYVLSLSTTSTEP